MTPLHTQAARDAAPTVAPQLDQDALEAARAAYVNAHPTQDIRGVIRDAIKAYLATANKLRPIESAPRDGSFFLAYYSNDWPEVLMWLSADKEFANKNGAIRRPTKWLPLPVVEGV